MNRVVKVVSLATAMACASMGALNSAHAQNSGDPLSLKIANAISPDRFFIRAGVIGVKVKTKSGDTYDVTGPVLTRDEIASITASGSTAISDVLVAKGYDRDNGTQNDADSIALALKNGVRGIGVLVSNMDRLGITQLGSPKGIKAVAKENAGTAGLSLGYFLDDEYKWVVEAYVLAAPLRTSVNASGPVSVFQNPETGDLQIKPFGLQGQKIIDTKLLPPTVLLGKYWGDKAARFRPYTGLIAMYAVFYDTKATDALNNYVGGASPGDTTVSLKNKFGVGPMLGFKYQLDDRWHINFNLGSVKLKTTGTLVTRNTTIKDTTGASFDYGADPALYEQYVNGDIAYPGSISDAINTGIVNYGNLYDVSQTGANANTQIRNATALFGGVAGITSQAIAYSKGQANLGTFVRKADSTLTNTIFMLSVGRSF